MHPLEKKIGTLLREKKILTPGEKVVVGVSAGPDSLCLLHVLNNVASDFSLSLVVVYFDHGLRPEESVHEIKFVEDEAHKMGWPFYLGAGDVRVFASGNGLSIEEAARTLRYAYLKETCSECGGHKIAVAHTADDQAEELMLRLIRGTGRKGLSGECSFCRDGFILRPFLETTKDEIYAYLKDKNTSYLTDSSNLERIYLRNRVRLDLIPYLEKNFNPGIKNILRQTASFLQDEESLLADLSVEAYDGAVSGEDKLCLNLSIFKKQHVAIQRRIIEKMLLELGNSPGFRQIDRILYLACQSESQSCIHLSNGLRGRIEGELFVFRIRKGGRRGEVT